MPNMVPVESSNIRAIGYDEDGLELWIEFNDYSTYVYGGVPSIVHDELIAAPSKGSYFNRVVKGNYGFRKQ
ncbi:KTSC domain-containing protein [Tsukamurella tyrosinosolvens]|uniref:KTSC domain-containing protein n=1 Tax=Tsukamurella tyrosinosolvens TaxID=57704 RepID=UPI002DD43455|nr:KTSC domain-containing protein [Tsukamurella tyrosinosolvens]MEC4611760.1 KTSC domain-containing protein [Tsukamurella tyrosinosolvens]